jgi:hypothetical protein
VARADALIPASYLIADAKHDDATGKPRKLANDHDNLDGASRWAHHKKYTVLELKYHEFSTVAMRHGPVFSVF